MRLGESPVLKAHLGEDLVYTRNEDQWTLRVILAEGSNVPAMREQDIFLDSPREETAWPQKYNPTTRELKVAIPPEDCDMNRIFAGMDIESIISLPDVGENLTDFAIYMPFYNAKLSESAIDAFLTKYGRYNSMYLFTGIRNEKIHLKNYPTEETGFAVALFAPIDIMSGAEIPQNVKEITFGPGCVFGKNLKMTLNPGTDCYGISIDMSQCDLSKVEDFASFFSGINYLGFGSYGGKTAEFRLPADDSKTINPIIADNMFSGCEYLRISQGKILFSRIESAAGMFAMGTALSNKHGSNSDAIELDLRTMDFSKLKDSALMFDGVDKRKKKPKITSIQRDWIYENRVKLGFRIDMTPEDLPLEVVD